MGMGSSIASSVLLATSLENDRAMATALQKSVAR